MSRPDKLSKSTNKNSTHRAETQAPTSTPVQAADSAGSLTASDPQTPSSDKIKSRKVSKPRVDRRKAPHTKVKILDAAESLFVQRGYYGTSLRDISKTADVQLALTHYHFGSKEDLFRAVIDRRADDNVASMRSALNEVIAAAGEAPPPVSALLQAFLGTVVDHSLRGGEGWRNYIRLLAQVANLPQEESFIVPVNVHYDSVVRDFIDAISRSYPQLERTDLHWYFYFFQAAMTHVLVESGMVDRQSDGLCRSSDLDTVAEKMTQFFTAGFNGLVQKKD